MKNILILVFIVLFSAHSVKAQRDEIGIQLGAMNYQGELAKYINYKSPGLTGGVFFRQNWNEAVSTKYTFALGQIQDSDSDSEELFDKLRNHDFTTTIIEASLQAEYNFFHFRNPREPQLWTPYLFGGIAGYKMSPQGNSNPNYSLFQVALPFGVGAKFVAGSNWNIGLEFGARKTFTDYLDDVEVRGARVPRYYEGNPHNKDWYFSTNITVSYTIYTKPCPRFYKL